MRAIESSMLVIAELEKRLALSKQYRQELINYLQSLKDKWLDKKLTYEEYEKIINTPYKGKKISEWFDYYDGYIKDCEERIKQEKRKILSKKAFSTFLYSIALITLFFAVFYASPKIIGYVIQEESEEFAQEINAEFTESGTYEIDLENTGILQSFRISGSIEGSGNVKIYLEDLLVLDSEKLPYKSNSEGNADTKKSSPITGFALKDETADFDSNTETAETGTEDTEASQKEQTEQTPAEQPIEETEESQEPEQNEQELPVDENLPASNEAKSSNETKLVKKFSYSCDETCKLEKFSLNKSSYTIKVEISNAKLNLEKVFYKLKPLALENITLEENVTNLTEAKIQTIQGQAVIGQPVKWTERIKFQNQNANFSVKIPKEAESVMTYKIENNEKLDITNEIEIKKGKTEKLKEQKKGTIASQSLEESGLKKDYKEVVINAEAEEVEIEYYTPAPESFEKEISKSKKQIVISGLDEIHYENVLAYTDIKESALLSIKLYWLVNGTKQLVENITYLDTNNNSLIDRIEWIVPHLSNQTYELILITKAEHLDENRNIIEDVYDLVKDKDYNYSEIPAGHYLRVVFEKKLTNSEDITIYARSNSSARIEVYEIDSSEKIADFGTISEENWYKVYLTNLQEEQDTFDLKVVDGSVEFDYVVDPANLTVETEALDVSLTPINKTSFVFAWVDKVRNAVSFKIYDVFGNIIVNTTDVDTNTLPDDSRVDVAMINSSAFVVGWIDGGEDDITFAIYNLNGNLIYGPTDLDTSVSINSNSSLPGNATDVSVSALGESFVVCYTDDEENDADAYTRLNSGAASAGEYNIDGGLNPDLPYQNLHSCVGINSTRFVSFHFDDGTANDASFAIYSPTSTTAVVGQTDIDTNVGTNAQVAVTNLNNTKFAMAFYDSADQDITIAIRTVNNAVVLAPTDIDLNVGSDSRVAIATINNNTQEDGFVVVWWSQATNSIIGGVYNGSGSQITAPFTIESNPNSNYPLLDVAGKDPITGNSICDGKFVVAYVNSSGSTIFKKYNINGSEWDSVCKETDNLPNVSLSYPPKNYFISIPSPINLTFNASVTDDHGIINCSLWHNATGTFHLNQTQNITGTSNITSFNLTNMFNVSFIWNIQCFDDAGQSAFGSENRSVKLSVSDTNPPAIMILGCNPSPVTLNQETTCNASIYEDTAISYVTANVTLPNSTVVYPVISNISSNYYFTFSQTDSRGRYNITWFANDTSANIATANASFNVGDIPFVLAVHPWPYETEQYQKSDYITLVANISDLDGLNITKAEVAKPDGTKENVTLYIPQPYDSFDFNTLGLVWTIENSSVGSNQLCVADIDNSIENKAFTSISGNGLPNTDTYCSLIFKYGTYGDFDMNVTFNITSESGADYAILFKILEKPSSLNSSKNLFLSIGNWTGYGRTYDVFVNDGNISEYLVERPTSDTFGKFRIKRQGDNFTFYTWNNTAGSWYEEIRQDNLDMPHVIFFALEAETAEVGWGSINVSWDDMNVESHRLYTGSFSNNTEEGIYNVTFIAIDSIGLINDSEKLQFEILEINDAPSTPFILNPTPDSVLHNTQNIIWSNVYDDENDALQFNITLLNPDFTENATIISNYGNSNTTSYEWNTKLFSDGVYSLKVLVFENETSERLSSYSIITGNFSIDNTKPQIQFIPPTPENNSQVSGIIFINVSATDAHLASIIIYNSTSELLICYSSPCTYEWNTSGYSSGSYEFYAVAEDVNGKTNSTEYLTLRISADNPPSITNLLPVSGSTYNISSNITIQATITDDFGISSAYANITLPNGTVQQIILTNLTSNNYSASFSNLNLKGIYNITFIANDTSGNVNSTETTWFERIVPENKTFDIIDTNNTYLDYTSNVLSNVSGILTLQFNLSNYKISQVIVEGYDERSPESIIKIKNYTSEQGFESTFLIDLSNANLTSANITINSSGYHLFKCSNFDLSSLACNEEDYTQIKTGLIPGQLYTITLNKSDPIFGETLQGPENSTDSYIRGGAATSNFGGSSFIRVGRTTGANSIRGLIWFNLSHIPSNATIQSANLSLYFYSIPSGDSTGNRTHNLHKIQQNPARPWTELNVTWNNYNSSNTWTTAGGDYEAIPTSNATFDSSALNSWIVFNVTSDVQNFTKNSSGNFGWIIKDSNEADTNIRRDYYSSGYSNSAFWPKLEISYTVGNTPPTHDNPILNSTFGTNLTTENLTCWPQNTSDLDGDEVKNIFNWYKNGESLIVLNLPFEGGSNSTFTKDYAYGNNGTVLGATWNSTGGFDGKGAYLFNGDDEIDVSDSANLDLTTELTIEAWIYPTSLTDEYNEIVSKGTLTDANYVLNLNYDELYFSFANNNIWNDHVTTNANLQTGRWYHVAATFNSQTGNVSLYVNGNLTYTSYENDTMYSNDIPLRIGNSAYGDYFDGYIDEIRIYRRVLSPEQISAIYQNKTNTIVSQETVFGETWQCEVTPNDGKDDGETKYSNNLTITAAPPEIIYVSEIENIDPIEASSTQVMFNVTIYDAEGFANINFSSISANFTRLGTTRIGSCANTANYSLYYANFSCLIDMWYFDSPGIWNISVSAKDNSGLTAYNTTTSFQYNQLQAIVLSPSVITWQSIISGSFNQTSDNDPAIINNTGNANLTIQINATNLLGEDYPEEIIFAGNISVSTNTGGSPPAECSGTTLSAGGFIDIANAVLSPGNLSAGLGKQNLYYCIKEIGDISSQVYSTRDSGSWTVRVVLALVAILPRKKKKKENKDNLIKAIGLLADELKARYSLNKLETIRMIAEELSERYKLSKSEISGIFNLNKESIPATIFSKEIGGLEALCKYMHENLNMSYHEIALAINRDDRTIWTAYQKAVRKMSRPLEVKETRMILPVSIFKNRRLTVLESAIIYMKSKGLRYNEISNLINRNQKNVWTIYSRAIKKLADANSNSAGL